MSNHDNQHHITRRVFFLISTGIGLVAAQPSALALSAVEQYVAGIGADVIRLANSNAPKASMRRRFSALVSRYANVRSVGLVALGPYQKQLPVNRRDEFFRLVADYIAVFFVSYIDDFKGARLNVISSADWRQLTGQNEAPSLAAASRHSSTRNEFCPSQTMRSPGPTPWSRSAFAS